MAQDLRIGQRFVKRTFDLVLAVPGLILASPVIAVAALFARRDTGASGIFRQRRIGRYGRPFTVYKIRTMRAVAGTSITTANDARITPLGARLRRWKIDELPQLWNVVRGEMSFVGPRPDVAGYADILEGDERAVLQLRPGITGPATLKYRDEEQLLLKTGDPERYTREVIWPDKVAINRAYMANYSLTQDIKLIWQTVTGR